MDNIKSLVERLKHIAGVLQDYGTAHLTGEQAVTQRNAITFLLEAADALAPLAEPVGMPELPNIRVFRWLDVNPDVKEYVVALRSALERALASVPTAGEVLYLALGRACIERLMRADVQCEPLGDVMLRLETIIRRSEQLVEATARADDTQRMLEAEHDAHMECHRRAEASERDAKRYRWLRENMTHHNCHPGGRPVLYDTSKRLWYHATDDLQADTLDAAIDSALDAAGKEHHD